MLYPTELRAQQKDISSWQTTAQALGQCRFYGCGGKLWTPTEAGQTLGELLKKKSEKVNAVVPFLVYKHIMNIFS
jgi:hypothetical protein